MNADLVYTLCSYLDLGSLLALAAADTILSPLVRKYMEKKKMEVELTLYYREESDVLPKPVWNEVSSRVLDIYGIIITQKDCSAISEDAYALLTKITTYCLEISFHSRSEARKVLRAITLRPRSDVTLFENARGPDR
ncbi:unnamed protein product [Heligmosomoides polygyrus]|uniref:DUF3475 domain-containing protein n=1 Tax=Heligmosomoides polygyrus TaxID=6339 RepID=A0A183F4U8_HELPZ|nr:unnamed protein product [Heligmosomoides polygyrus]